MSHIIVAYFTSIEIFNTILYCSFCFYLAHTFAQFLGIIGCSISYVGVVVFNTTFNNISVKIVTVLSYAQINRLSYIYFNYEIQRKWIWS